MPDRDPGRPAGIAAPADLAGGAHVASDRPPPAERTDVADDGWLGSEPRLAAPLPPSFPWLALAATALIALGLLWQAAEQHYQGCVAAVEARTGTTALDRLVRQREVEGCSRLPF